MSLRSLLAAALLAIVLPLTLQAQETKPTEKPAEPATESPAVPKELPTRAKLEADFSEQLSGAVLVGRFTIDGQAKPPKEERYEISKATKVEGDDWLITSSVKFGDVNVTVPIKLQVKWAGDTPVMTLTDLTIPGLGTFTSRVLFYGDRYVGTWQHGEVGGHMYGRVEKVQGEKPAATPAAQATPTPKKPTTVKPPVKKPAAVKKP